MNIRLIWKAAGTLLAALLLPTLASAQKVEQYIDFELNLANNHLWRGIEVSDGLVTTSSIAVHDKHQHLRFGLWGGTNTQGNYKEFNYFAEFKHKEWKLALWDTYNFSPGADYNNKEFFNYSARTTGRFLDATLSHQGGARFPLSLSWSTILFGRDRNADNTANKYSTFIYASYPLFEDNVWRFDVGCGGTFALNRGGDDATFYSAHTGIIHVQLQATRQLRITDRFTLPVHVMMVWNPECDRAFFQIGTQLLKF